MRVSIPSNHLFSRIAYNFLYTKRLYSNLPKDKLPSEKDAQRSNISRWVTTKLDEIQEKLINASQTINDVTGYSSIAELRSQIEKAEETERNYRMRLRQCRKNYDDAINKRSESQQEVNELLQRKSAWSAKDLERFTELYKNDHVNESAVAASQEELNKVEVELEDCQERLNKLISRRYREEQIWSDKIRRASTYGTWALMAFNIVLFIVVQLGLEPWRRRRLVASFEDKVKTVIEAEVHPIEFHPSVPSEPEVDTVEPETKHLNWKNLPSRLGEALNKETALKIRPSEAFVSGCAFVGLGALLGGLLVALCK